MKTETYNSKILWYQSIGFSIIIALSWLDQLFGFADHQGGPAFNWRQGVFENLIILAVAVPMMLLTRTLLSRLYYLEGFLRVCAWCKKIEDNDDWIPIETYFKEHFKTESSHGICPDCLEKTRQKIHRSRED